MVNKCLEYLNLAVQISLRACLECGIFFPFLRFFYEIELIPVKFL